MTLHPLLRNLAAAAMLILAATSYGQDAKSETSSPGALDVSNFDASEGYYNFYWDDAEGKIWLDIGRFDEPFLYVSSLASGLGSNPVGLDRGQLGQSRVVHFKRVGNRAFLVQQNLKYRVSTNNDAERRAIQDSFAPSVIWSGQLKPTSSGGHVVDLTDFLLRDAHDCIGTLSRSGQGSFTLERNRSYIHLQRTKSFPENTEFESALTFTSRKPGPLARRTAADGRSITLRQHHSFVKLPDDDYLPRRFDPRCGCFSIGFSDYGVPIDEPLDTQWITRHRLKKRDPDAERSRPVEPIIYYVDPGVPQPVRDALIEGASWWSAAFDAAGFQDAFEVRVLPAGEDPMDVRYNVIQWVHRATRGWSYGQSVIDPRTGEIIKGHVLLGSLRVRQDHLLFEGLRPGGNLTANACSCGMGSIPSEAYLSQLAPGASSVEVALARIRQLAAHEVGHTLGFAHNFAASTYADRASVMDYPAPRAKLVDGQIDLTDAYGVGIGEWDKFTVQYAYSEFPRDREAGELNQLVAGAISRRMLYVTDADARPAGAAHPLGNLWDNGSDPVTALGHEMEVRRIALESFDASVLADNQPLADLEKTFVPLYLHHRYQVDAAAKMLGGYEYNYAVRGDGQVPVAAVPDGRQREALEELIKTIQPEALVIPQRILDLLPPKVGSSASDRERFSSQTSPLFDPRAAMRSAADLTIANLLQAQRASRLVRIEDDHWGLAAVIDTVIRATCESDWADDSRAREAQRVVQQVFVDRLIGLAGNTGAAAEARAVATAKLRTLVSRFTRQLGAGEALGRYHLRYLIQRIERFLDRPAPAAKQIPPIELPPGSPIGMDWQVR